MCDHGTNLSTIRTEYLINSKKKTKNKQTKYGRVYNKYNTIYPLNLEKKFIKFKIFILQIIIVGTKRRYGILVPNSKRVYPICPINNGMLFAAIIDIRGMLQK